MYSFWKKFNGEPQSLFLMIIYRVKLLKLSMLPLMFALELNKLLFFIKSIKNPSSHCDITKWFHFNSSGSTRSSSHFKLVHNHTNFTPSCHFYFNRLATMFMDPLTYRNTKETIDQHIILVHFNFKLKFDDNNYCTYHVVYPCHKCSSTPTTHLLN